MDRILINQEQIKQRIKDEKIQELTTYVVDTALNSEAHWNMQS